DHPLPATAGLHRAGPGPRARPGPDRQVGRAGARPRARGARLRMDRRPGGPGGCREQPAGGRTERGMTATVGARSGAASVASAREANAARWRAAFEARAATLPAGPDWLAALRRGALARFVEEGWPSNRLESWR